MVSRFLSILGVRVMSELKEGGLAIIIKSRFPENVGKVVKTSKFIGISEPYYTNCWEIIATSHLTGTLYPIGDGDFAIAPETSLMPIDGDDFSHENDRQKELSHG